MAHYTTTGGWRTLVLGLAGFAVLVGRSRADEKADLNAMWLRASELAEQGKHGEAEKLYERAVRLAPRVFGPEHLDTASLLNNLANVYSDQGKYAESEPLHRRALAIREKALGPDHPYVARSLTNLAAMYSDQGKYGEAEPLYSRALAIFEKALGPDHPDVAGRLTSLALLYKAQAKYGEAEPLFRRALAFREMALGPDHPGTAGGLANLALLYRAQGKFGEAEPLHRRALAIFEKALGPDHPDVAASLNNLAVLYNAQGKAGEAEPLFRRALSIREKAFGPDHPNVAESLNNLATLYLAQGKYTELEPLYRRALAIKERALGPDHPDVALGLYNLAILRCAQMEWKDAGDLLDRQRRGVRRFVARELPALPQADQLTFLEATDEDNLHVALALGLERRSDPTLASRSAEWLANGKAVAHQALAERALVERDLSSPARRELMQQLQDVRRRHAALAMVTAKPGEEGQRTDQLRVLDSQRVELERKLATASGSTPRPADPWVDLADIRRRVPADGVLVEIARFRGHDFAKAKIVAPRYAAWLIPPAGQGDVQIIDLGPANVIDAAVVAVRKAMQDAQGDSLNRSKTVEVKSLSRPKSIAAIGERDAEAMTRQPLDALAKLVLHPLLPTIAGKVHWIVSPDASLWLVPWAALPLDRTTYAIEKHTIIHVVSGRDLAAARPTPRTDGGAPTVLADPDFDLSPADAAVLTKKLLPGSQSVAQGLGGLPPSARLSKVSRLPGTATEATAIKPSIQKYGGREPWLYVGGNALEAVAKALKGPRVAVFSTHGFALPDQEVERDDKAGPSADNSKKAVKVKGGGALENPLLRCGLLLAGCNRRGEGTGEDGVLTGLEIVGTDLRGTELVVLSACETGLGDVRNGEGVAGLRQAFQLAGARSVVATLWQVPDRESAALMAAFFDGLAAGQPKADALRAAQLAQIESRRKQGGAAHPYFWAAYTLTGS
ncbi:MAG: CHAT domain-containing tetratricopeptide repeat protein [Gemmataceae bacterium]